MTLTTGVWDTSTGRRGYSTAKSHARTHQQHFLSETVATGRLQWATSVVRVTTERFMPALHHHLVAGRELRDGRPCQTWLRTMENDIRPYNQGLTSAKPVKVRRRKGEGYVKDMKLMTMMIRYYLYLTHLYWKKPTQEWYSYQELRKIR